MRVRRCYAARPIHCSPAAGPPAPALLCIQPPKRVSCGTRGLMDPDVVFGGKRQICAIGWVVTLICGEFLLGGKRQLKIIFRCLHIVRLLHACSSPTFAGRMRWSSAEDKAFPAAFSSCRRTSDSRSENSKSVFAPIGSQMHHFYVYLAFRYFGS